jgi:hypothetical protein
MFDISAMLLSFTHPHLVVVVGLVRLWDPQSSASGSLTTSRATHAGKVRG